MKKVVNLADRKEALDLLKQLYCDKDVTDDTDITDTERESGTESSCEVVELPSSFT